jgi:hypothetical protein
MNKDLLLEDGSTLAWLPKDYRYYLNKTTLLFGRTQSGKSTIIDEIMYLCKDHIPMIYVICQSSITPESSPYYGKIPTNCIKSGITTEWIEELMENQKGRAAIYDTANNIKNLKSVFNRVVGQDAILKEHTILTETKKCIEKIQRNDKISFSDKKSKITELNKIKNSHLTKLYKDIIRKHLIELEAMTGLSEQEMCCVKYLDFRPELAIIYDDCASMFKQWCKESSTIEETFYNGRHYYITQIISSQDDKIIASELRKNSLITIFTTAQAAIANFERASNSYPKHEKKKAAICIKSVFNTNKNSNEVNFKKLIYMQTNTTNSPFAYTIADLYDEFRMGCDAIWKIDEKINEKVGNNLMNNSFFSKYVKA